MRVPLGVVGIIYENRPNVTSDAAALCLKSGNAVLLRGSLGGASRSNQAIAAVLREGYEKAGLPRRRPPPGRGHQPRVGPGVHAAAGCHRLPDPAAAARPDPGHPASTPPCPT